MNWSPPSHCGKGHAQVFPDAVTNWTPCDCSTATGKSRGHRQQRCEVCGWRYRENGCDKLVDGYAT